MSRITPELFDEIINNRMATCKELLQVKGKEYVRNGDRLHNFNRAAQMRNLTPLESLQGFLDKHLISWFDLIEDLKDPEKAKNITMEYVNEKIGDIDTYFHLAEVVVVDRLMEVKESLSVAEEKENVKYILIKQFNNHYPIGSIAELIKISPLMKPYFQINYNDTIYGTAAVDIVYSRQECWVLI